MERAGRCADSMLSARDARHAAMVFLAHARGAARRLHAAMLLEAPRFPVSQKRGAVAALPPIRDIAVPSLPSSPRRRCRAPQTLSFIL